MSGNRQPRGVICFTNQHQFPHILAKGMYGNVSAGDQPSNPSDARSVSASRRNRFGKLKDLFCVAPGDLVFFFEKKAEASLEEGKLHGVWKVTDEPFYCTAMDFDASDSYPYRFYIEPYYDFPTTIPPMELRKLLNKNLLWSIRTFERESNAAFASINPISSKETDALLDLFWRYNHRIILPQSLKSYNHSPFQNSMNFHDLVMNGVLSSPTPVQLKADSLGVTAQGDVYEYAIHAYLLRNLIDRSQDMLKHFGAYNDVLREVPISVAGQNRPDVLLIYNNPMTGEPSVHSIIEVKRVEVNRDMLKQLLEYLRLYSERHAIDFNAVEGIYIGPKFKDDAIKYIVERAKVEVERPVRLLTYSIVGNQIKLQTVVI